MLTADRKPSFVIRNRVRQIIRSAWKIILVLSALQRNIQENIMENPRTLIIHVTLPGEGNACMAFTALMSDSPIGLSPSKS